MKSIEKRISELENRVTGTNKSDLAAYVRKHIPDWNGTTRQAFHKFLELNKPDHEINKG